MGPRQHAPEVRRAPRRDHRDLDGDQVLRDRRHDVVEPTAARVPRHDRAAGLLADVPHPRHGSVRQRGRRARPTTGAIPGGAPPPSPYAAAVLADSPSWQWRLGEASGTKAFDRAGSNDVTLNSANNAEHRRARCSNESDTGDELPGHDEHGAGAGRRHRSGDRARRPSRSKTWLKTSTNTGGKIIGFGDSNTGRSSTNGNDRNLYMNNAGQIYFGVRPDMGTRITINSPGELPRQPVAPRRRDVGQRRHEAVRRRQPGREPKRDKKAQVYRGYWRVGGDNLSSWPSQPTREAITAQLDEIAVYPYALSAGRVGAHYAASGRGGSVPNDPPTAAFTFSTQSSSAVFIQRGVVERQRRIDRVVQLELR